MHIATKRSPPIVLRVTIMLVEKKLLFSECDTEVVCLGLQKNDHVAPHSEHRPSPHMKRLAVTFRKLIPFNSFLDIAKNFLKSLTTLLLSKANLILGLDVSLDLVIIFMCVSL